MIGGIFDVIMIVVWFAMILFLGFIKITNWGLFFIAWIFME